MVDVPVWRVRPNAPQPGTVLGPMDAIPVGGAKEYRFGRGRSAFSMFVVRIAGEDARGYLNLCPHFSLPLNHVPDQFMHEGLIRCLQHFAVFRPEDGFCVSGACEGSRLDPIGIGRTPDGMLVIAP